MIGEALSYPFFRAALMAGLLASIACGVMGTYVVVRRVTSLAGGLAHAAFGGVGLGYLLGFDPLLGAAGFAIVAGSSIRILQRSRHQSTDTLVSMFWSLGMASGLLFASLKKGYTPDLMSYLFGSILFVSTRDLVFLGCMDLLIVLSAILLFREFQAITFDEEFSELVGLPVEGLAHYLMALISLAVVVLIQVVGVLLSIALLSIPAATARHWTQNMAPTMLLATALSAVSVTSGLLLSYWASSALNWELPTGPSVIVCASLIYFASYIAAGRRGGL